VATTSPSPSDEQLAAACAVSSRPSAGLFSRIRDAVLRRTRLALVDHLRWMLPRGPVLDVGAGDGTLVRAFRQRGRTAIGVNPYASGSDPQVRAVEFADMTGSWSGVIFWHSLEHLRQPVQALRHAAALLVPGGVLLVAVPNATSLQARLFGDRWLALDRSRHLVHLTPAALLAQIEDLGFRIERVSYLRGGRLLSGWLHGIVGWLPGHPDLAGGIGRGEARPTARSLAFRLYAVVAAVAVLPLALIGTAIEVATRSSGTVYVEARRGRPRRPAGTARLR
jgi:SAM-dependent methyltransferase